MGSYICLSPPYIILQLLVSFVHCNFFSVSLKTGNFMCLCFSTSSNSSSLPVIHLTIKVVWTSSLFMLSTVLALPGCLFDTYRYSKFPHKRLLYSWQLSLVVWLLPFRLQIGWLYSGISSRIGKTFIPPWLSPQSFSRLHLGQVRMRFG